MRAMRSQAKVTRAKYRGEQRVPLGRPGMLRREGCDQLVIRIADLTRDGCRIEVDGALLPNVLAPDEQVVIAMAGIGSIPARIVRRSASGYGCVFLQSLSPGAVSAAFEDNVVALPGGADLATGDALGVAGPVQPQISYSAASPRMTIAVVAMISAAGWVLFFWGVFSL